MSRGVNGGWDFVKVGETYQYKEDWFFAMVKVLENNSDDEYYRFTLQVEKATHFPFFAKDGIFEIYHDKSFNGIYSGMNQIYEAKEYMCTYKYFRENNQK